MILTKHLDKTEESLLMLDGSLPQANADRFIYGLKQRKWKEWDIVQFTVNVRNSHSYAIMENQRLKAWGDTFNDEYATDHNNYFTTAEKTMNRIRCTLSGLTKTVFKLCYSSKKQLPADTEAPLIYERSPLLKGPYSPDMFGKDSFGKSVQMLYDELMSYLNTVGENITLCLDVIERENYIRQHPEECQELHDKCFTDTFNHNRTIIRRLKELNANMDNDIAEALDNAEDAQAMIAELFHMLNVDQWNDYVICTAVKTANRIGLDKTELFLWGKEGVNQVMRVRCLLDHIDELDVTKEKQKNKLSGYFLMRLLNWCDIKDKSQHGMLLEYVRRRVTHKFGTQYKLALIGAVNAEKRKIVKTLSNHEEQQQQQNFNEKADALLAKYGL